MDLKLEVDIAEARLGATNGLVVLDWLKSPTLTAAGRIGESMTRLIRKDGPPQLMLTLANATVGPPDGSTREILTQQINQLGRTLAGVAIAVEGTGFGAAAVRAIVSGMYIVTRPTYPVKIFASVAESSDWLVENWKAGAKPLSTEIVAAVAALRKR